MWEVLIGTPTKTEARVRSGKADDPPAAVDGGSENGAQAVPDPTGARRPGEQVELLVEQGSGDLRRVHSDLQAPPAARASKVVPGVSQALIELPAPLGDNLDAGWQPRSGAAGQGDHLAVRLAGGDRVEGVGQCRLGDGGGLDRGAWADTAGS